MKPKMILLPFQNFLSAVHGFSTESVDLQSLAPVHGQDRDQLCDWRSVDSYFETDQKIFINC